jgi:hypothetical protein
MKKLIMILCLLLLNSCLKTKEDVHNDLNGGWVIHRIIYKGEDYRDHILSINLIDIKEDYSLSIPEIDDFKKEKNAKWKFDYTKGSIIFTIESVNKVFNNTYKAYFYENDTLDKLILKSEFLDLELHKMTR